MPRPKKIIKKECEQMYRPIGHETICDQIHRPKKLASLGRGICSHSFLITFLGRGICSKSFSPRRRFTGNVILRVTLTLMVDNPTFSFSTFSFFFSFSWFLFFWFMDPLLNGVSTVLRLGHTTHTFFWFYAWTRSLLITLLIRFLGDFFWLGYLFSL